MHRNFSLPLSVSPDDCTFLLFTCIDDAGDSAISSSCDCDCTITIGVVVAVVFEGDVGSVEFPRDEPPRRCFDL